ncbi:hypothetical protein [Brevundimonas sp. SL130]|uniref:hypothetical protein n=1 Tax=Brevundimonas sp. SL130 TaxID=2995143 RepID=UPI00226CC0A4|nr:hypothetical protein [Brevundimonas sp. SL130]WAC58961.1 hypothetical protein OU998_12140 [Brevundimonas sp. SL130]
MGAFGLASVAKADCAIGDPGATRSVAFGPDRRTVQIHIPRGFDPAKPAPLVFVLHARSTDGLK